MLERDNPGDPGDPGDPDDPDDPGEVAVIGVVPTDGRGSWPFALLHGESLVAVASWALGEAGAALADFTASWAEVQASEAPLVVHDPLCPATPVPFLVSAVRECVRTGAVVVGARPVTDTVVHADGEELGERLDRESLRAVCSPVVLPAAVVAALPDWPPLTDLAELVGALAGEYDVTFLDAPPAARRVADESDLRVLEALGVSG